MIAPLILKKKNGSSLLDSLRERQVHVVHLTHNDLDAVGADAIHRMAYGGVFSIFTSVSNFASMLQLIADLPGKGDLLSITDLGYQRGVEDAMRALQENGWRVEWRDHHRWEEGDIQRVRDLVSLLKVDTSTCACGIVAWDLKRGDPMAEEVARVVCDYDMWRNEDPRAAVLARVVAKNENRAYVRDALVKGIFTDDFIASESLRIEGEMQDCIRWSIRHTRIYGVRYRIAVAPLYGYPSETAAAIRESAKTDIEVLVSSNGRFSIRSVPPISHLVAREFDGGGHPHAAGGNFGFSIFDRFVFLLLKWTVHFQRLVERAEIIGSRTPSI
ncbi:MAG: phosphoesterase [Methanomicrobiales archaeon]|nr:phosphoesterase [Methanomicrobiales archaeon]